MDFSHHAQALLISLASSTDNFLVGISVGLAAKPLQPRVLWGIALCNAAGCFIATSGGEVGGSLVSNQTAHAIACLAFAYLAVREYAETQDNNGRQAPRNVSLDLALPMTANNLAGGVTGGLLGIWPFWNFLYALVGSVLTMWVGYRLGKSLSTMRQNDLLMKVSIYIYIILALQSLLDMLGS